MEQNLYAARTLLQVRTPQRIPWERPKYPSDLMNADTSLHSKNSNAKTDLTQRIYWCHRTSTLNLCRLLTFCSQPQNPSWIPIHFRIHFKYLRSREHSFLNKIHMCFNPSQVKCSQRFTCEITGVLFQRKHLNRHKIHLFYI